MRRGDNWPVAGGKDHAGKARPVDIPDGHAEKRRLSTLHQPISNSIDEATM